VNSDLGEPLKAVRVDLDQDKVRALGLSTEAVQKTLQAAIAGAGVTTYRDRDLALDVVMRLDTAERTDLGRIANLPIATQSGPVALSQLGRVTAGSEPACSTSATGSRRSPSPPTSRASRPPTSPSASNPRSRRCAGPSAGASLVNGGSEEQSSINQRATMAAVPPR
jgi:multidrug efflux pump